LGSMFQSHSTLFSEVSTFTVPLLADRRGGFVKLMSALSSEITGEFSVKEVFATMSNKNVLRGLHFQAPPRDQSKFVVVLSGIVHEVVVDIREGSPTYGQTAEMVLKAPNINEAGTATGIFVPSGFAHGYVVLSDEATVLYLANHDFDGELDGGIAWDSTDATWPIKDPILSDKDLSLPLLRDFKSPFKFAGSA
jgi:dTDP-4-dehydrorhamnose 3,5-epimerase